MLGVVFCMWNACSWLVTIYLLVVISYFFSPSSRLLVPLCPAFSPSPSLCLPYAFPSPLPPFMSLIHVDSFYMLCELLTNPRIFHSSAVSDLSRVKLPNTSEAVSCLYILLNKSWHLVSEVLLSPTPQLVSLCSVVSRLFFTLGSRIILSNHTHMLYTTIKILV